MVRLCDIRKNTRWIALLALLLIMVCGKAGAATVTYHILTKPFTTYENNGSVRNANIRVEALRCTSDASTVGLPDAYKSPLLKDAAYTYYKSATASGLTQIYANNGNIKFRTYTLSEGDVVGQGSALTAIGNPTDIYVIYDNYDPSNSTYCTELGQKLKLDGSIVYNIELGSKEFFGYHALRGNRPGVISETWLNSATQLGDDEITECTDGYNNQYGVKGKNFFFKWRLVGNDPYNIQLALAYDGTGTYTETTERTIKGPLTPSTTNIIFCQINNTGSSAAMWLSNEADYIWSNGAWTSKPGYYRNMNPPFDSFALLFYDYTKGEDGRFTLVGSKINCNDKNWQPSSGKYMHLMKYDGRDPKIVLKSASEAAKIQLWEVKEYVYKVKMPDGTTTLSAPLKMSTYYGDKNPKDYVPKALWRKYVNFTGTYSDAAMSDAVNSYADAETQCALEDDGKRVIWVKYESTLPYTFAPWGTTDYDQLTWYNFYMNKESQYIVGYDDTSTSTNFIINGYNSKTWSRYSRNTHYAFVGDPYQMKIISRKATDDHSGTPYYITLGANPTTDNMVCDGTGTTWELVYDDNTGYYADCFHIQQFQDDDHRDTHNYFSWRYQNTAQGQTVAHNSESEAGRFVLLSPPKKNYVYHIMRADHSVAVKQTKSQEASTKLDYAHIPDTIRSPFLALPGVTLKFYDTAEKAIDETSGTDITYAPDNGTSDTQHIWVRYDMGTALSNAPGSYISSGSSTEFNVRLNGEYIYYDSASGTIKSKASITDSEASTAPYLWRLGGNDPYAMTIYNDEKREYVTVSNWADGSISWSSSAPASKYIIRQSTYTGVYEVMAATGDAIDAATTYYNIGRIGNTVMMVSNAVSSHGSATLRFLLTPKDANPVMYHLIDKNGDDLIQVTARQAPGMEPEFPTDYRSPLVTSYYYYTTMEKAAVVNHIGDASDQDTDGIKDVYVFYDVTDKVDMSSKKTMYVLKFESGTPFRAEDGSDGLEASAVTPVYPYCNGDGNFFVYGEEQFEIQKNSAASTRTRWGWYLESENNDPYHVKICSRQTETYNEDERSAYFLTYQPDDYDKIVTTLTWPSISGTQGTEYMILGSANHYRLETTYMVALDSDHNNTPESNERRIVNSFEQYWKTYDTVKNKLLAGEGLLDASDVGANPNGATTVEKEKYRTFLTKPKEDGGKYEFHAYEKWAYAKRFNGYNSAGKTSKGWEEIEHWFETVYMGEGYFDLVPIDIAAVMILLDQHGWEIMRKPLPTSPDDPMKAAKYDEIRPYDSPMVKEYYFWTKASKRSGFHQYYNLSQQVTVDGKPYTSTTLTKLPDYDKATNLHDAKGNHLDEYVTYTVKDEYLQSFSVEYTTESAKDASDKSYTKIASVTGTGQPFLIEQGTHYATVASAEATAVTPGDVPATGGMSQYIIDNVSELTTTGAKKNELWYVMPNLNIDVEMGYGDPAVSSTVASWVNDYRDKAKVKESGFNSWAFDPYNIQLSSVPYTTKYFVTNATKGTLEEGEGSIIGDGTTVALGSQQSIVGTWYDSRKLAITNATFMAVQDADGHLQLMPRFDQTKRMSDFNALVSPNDLNVDKTYTKLYRPMVYQYHIIDNNGRESLRYRSGGDLVPQTPDHFKSPLAKEFTYYKTLTDGAVSNEITASLAGAKLTASTNDLYVRYSYDSEADLLDVLQGKWLTMKLNNLDTQYNIETPVGIYTGEKPATIDAGAKKWQWKFLESPQSKPDPYAVSMFNRSNTGVALPTGKRFALLSHEDGGYALAEAGTANADYSTYTFLSDDGMTAPSAGSPKAAEIIQESSFLSTSCDFSGTKSQVKLTDDVKHTYTYNIYTNGGVLAISADQDFQTALDNFFVPDLPKEIASPLLKTDQYRYYEQSLAGNVAAADTVGKALNKLYGLYDDVVNVHYTAYDPLLTEYKVPNERNSTEEDVVARASTSNDASIDLNNDLLYNIFWYDDKIMKGNGSSIEGEDNQGIKGGYYVWTFDGSDPYAIKIRNKESNQYVNMSSSTTCNLTGSTPTTFMLLPRDDEFKYGMLQVTGRSEKLTGDGSTLVTDGAPNKFIIFALSTHKVTYHLVIANIGSTEQIYYPDYQTKLTIQGTTQRNLTTNAIPDHPVGHVSLGDYFKVPQEMYRPNVVYDFFVGDIYDVDKSTNPETETLNTELTHQYKGHKEKAMGKDNALVDKHVHVNIVYSFNGDLETNSGEGFVTDISQNKWYTVEALIDDKPWLAQYTNAWGFEAKEGRGTHYTNDYLWSPIGDPYGFLLFNRYMDVNSGADNKGEKNKVITTKEETFSEDQQVIMGNYLKDTITVIPGGAPTDAIPYTRLHTNGVYELLESSTSGYFRFHPVANSSGDSLYLHMVDGTDADNNPHKYIKLSTTPTELTFGLSEDLVTPYYEHAGYVGGLNAEGKAAYEAANGDLVKRQEVVYNPKYIIKYTPGYYRLHSPADIKAIDSEDELPVRYASGYTHKSELTAGEGGNPIPMHYYERKGVNTTFEILAAGLRSSTGKTGVNGHKISVATRGAIPISAPEYDPASIFYFYQGSSDVPLSKVKTQGLYIKGEKAKSVVEATGERSLAIMTENEADAMELYVMDIGGTVMLIHDNQTAAGRKDLKYLCYDQNDMDSIYDLKMTHNTHTDHAKWLMEPVNNQGLLLKVNSGGDAETFGSNRYYTTFCAPFDVLLPEDVEAVYDKGTLKTAGKMYRAYICQDSFSPWNEDEGLHPQRIGKYNTEESGCPEPYRQSKRFVPAGTPVIITTDDNAGSIKLTIPTKSPSPALPSIFSGKYLEQLLTDYIGESDKIYTFGVPLSGNDLHLNTGSSAQNGEVTGSGIQSEKTGIGFYINATPNKELGLGKGSWTRNNRYVLANRIYYRAGSSGANARESKGSTFIPVIFDDDDEEQEIQEGGRQRFDRRAYDLQGRCVASEQQVADGTWRLTAKPGIYIVAGKKIVIR